MIVAIDGPAGSGKSSTARALAERVGLMYLDTGAMYRAVALRFLESGKKADDSDAEEVLRNIRIDFQESEGTTRILLDGKDVTDQIRTPEVTEMSSRVGTLRAVREKMVREQRRIAAESERIGIGVIVEGRDIGTVVFPNADLKVFMDASAKERAARRMAEMSRAGVPVEYEKVLREITDRDNRDMNRSLSPLYAADNAIILDTTDLSFQGQLDALERMIRERL